MVVPWRGLWFMVHTLATPSCSIETAPLVYTITTRCRGTTLTYLQYLQLQSVGRIHNVKLERGYLRSGGAWALNRIYCRMNTEEGLDSPGESSGFLPEDAVPGASLKGRDPELLKVPELKRWLQCRRASTKGRKPELITR